VRTLIARRRVVLPLVAAVLCLAIVNLVGPILAWVLLIASFGFILDAVTMMWPQGDNLTKYRQ
jgi:hypothetical protein